MKSVTYKGKKFDSISDAAKQLVNVENMKVKDVSKALGVSYLSVYQATKASDKAKERAKKYDIIRRAKIGQDVKRIAEKTDISKAIISNTIKTKLNTKKYQTMVMRKSGKTTKQIAKALGLSERYVRRMVQK